MCHTMKGEIFISYKIVLYEKDNGEEPVKTFIYQSDVKMQAKIVGLLDVLEEKGNLLREPYSKYLEDGIFELRCQVGNNITRILYFFYYQKQIVLTNGFVKKTQKTPRREIELAKQRKNEYIKRVEKHDNISRIKR